VRPWIMLRIASVLALLHFAGHTFGVVLARPRGPEELAVIEAMRSYRFSAMGAPLTYWDYYLGFGLFVSAALLLHAALFWQLSGLARTEPARARPFLFTLLAAYAAFSLLSWIYFFAGPILAATAITVCLGLACIRAPGDALD
jgi:hypothetical protein